MTDLQTTQPVTMLQPDGFENAGQFIVFGAAGGIGRAVCTQLDTLGASIDGYTRSDESLQRLNADSVCENMGMVDVTQFDAVEQCLTDVAQRSGKIAGVVNSVGSILLKPAHLTTADDWAKTIALNLTSAFAVVRAAGKVMRDGGSIVLVSTAAAQTGLPNHEAIAAAKAGVEGLARSAAATYAMRGLRINVVAPGLVDTPLASNIVNNERALNASLSMHAIGRVGQPEDIASAIVWLLDPAQSWVTGQVIHVDGGLANVRPRIGA